MNERESRDYLENELDLIKQWEKYQKGLFFWEKLGRLPFMLLDKLTPKFLQDKISLALDEVGNYIQSGGRYLIRERHVLDRFTSYPPAIAEIGNLTLSEMDKVADELSVSRSKLATIQGATTGFGGIFTLAIDIPALLGLSLKVLQEIAISYGYDPNDKIERVFIVKCMQFSSSDIVGKKAIIEELSTFNEDRQNNQTISQLQGWREVVMTYRDNFGWKKLFQMIPIAGMLFGAFINKSTIQDVAEAGKMLYRKRRILDKLEQL